MAMKNYPDSSLTQMIQAVGDRSSISKLRKADQA